MRRTLGFLLLALCGLMPLACKQKDQTGVATTGDVPVGEYGSLTGNTATFGTSSHDGSLLALEQINSAGGVLAGRRIKLITEDDRSDANEAVAAVEKLINRDKVVAVVGEVASSRSLAGGGVCQNDHIPMVSPASTNPDVTWDRGKNAVKDFIFRACFIDDFQGSVMAEFATKRGWKRVAILTDANSDYSKGLAKAFRETFAKGGGQMSDDSFRTGDKDFRAHFTKIATWGPDAVFVPGYYNDVGLILPQAHSEVGLKVPFFGGDGWDSPETLKLGPVADGCFYSDHYSPEDPRPEVQAFIKTYQAKYGHTPDAMAVLGYDAMNLVADAIKRAGSTDPKAIRDALAQTKDFQGVSGTITLDDHHNARKPIVILELQGGKTKLVDTIKP